MSQTLRKQYHSFIAQTFLNDIQYQRSNYYYFLGKLEPWGGTDLPPGSAQELSEAEDIAIRNNSAYFKKITPNDVTLVCPRNDWVSGIVYAQWDDTQDMEGELFYVVTDEDSVWKCLNNFNGSQSTVKPTGKPLAPLQTADGYVWKYMYTIPSFKKTRFTSVNYIPVQRALSDSFYSQGSVESVSVLRGGTGYTDTLQTTITASGTTTGSGATATFTVNGSGGIASVTVTAGGTGYTNGVRVGFSTVIGQNAVLVANVTAGVVTSVTIVNPGNGYSTSTDSIQFTVGGAILIPIVSRISGSIIDVTVVDGGAGYSGVPTLTIGTTVAATVDGLYSGNSTAIVTAIVDGGSIKRVLIADPGVGYPSSADTSITIQGDGIDLDLTPVIYQGSLVDIIVENPGYGYTNLVLTVNGSGTGALLRPIFANSDVVSDQSVIEQTAIDGAIHSIVLTEGGTGYNNTTQVVITGDGTGATAHAVVVGNSITQIIVDTWGSGYTKATVTFNDPNRSNVFNEFVDATAYAILPPAGGHGVDAVKELYGRTLAISSSIRSDPLLTQYGQDYRQFGLISQPRTLITNKIAYNDFDFNAYQCTFEYTTDLVIDEILVLDVYFKYRVVYIDDLTVYLQPLQRTLQEPIGVLVAESNINRTYNSDELVSRPIINKYTGSLLYIANEEPFEFSDTQGLLIKTYISF